MAIASIQPIMSFNVSGFSAVMQATATSPPQLLTVTTHAVTTPLASTVVTLGSVQPMSQPLFDASGRLIGGTGTTGTVGRLIDANLALAGSASPDLTAVDATGIGAASLLASPTGTTGSVLNRSLAADVQTAVAGLDGSGGLGTGPSTIGTVDLLNPNAAPLGAVTTPAVTGATAPASALPNEAAQGAAAANAEAVSGAAIAPTVTPFPSATSATPGAATALTESAAGTGTTIAATAAATPATAGTTTGTALPGTDATAALRQLVNDATARAVNRLTDPAFANVAAALFVSAGVFRSLGGTQQQPVTGTADTVAVPAPQVTPARPVQPV